MAKRTSTSTTQATHAERRGSSRSSGSGAGAGAGLGSSFDVVTSLTSGGMGDLLLAARREPSGMRNLFVLKQLRRTLSLDPAFRELFVREGRLASKLSHVNIVATHAVGERDAAPYVAMEYLEAQTLESLMVAMGQAAYAVDPRMWVLVLCDVLAGLHHAHEARGEDGAPLGIVHRDVNPQNILVTYAGRVVLIDFASATLSAVASHIDSDSLTSRVDYAAPEVLAGAPSDCRADVFSAGIVLWELLAERRAPYNMLGEASIHRRLPNLTTVRPEVDPRLATIVAKAVEIDPGHRYATAAEMRAALDSFADAAGRMLRRDALASLMAVLFDEERRRVEDDVRLRLAKLDGKIADEEPAPRSKVKPRLELVDSDDELPEPKHALDELSVLSMADILSLGDLESEPSFVAAVSIPEGAETSRPNDDALLVDPRVHETPTRPVLEETTMPGHLATTVGLKSTFDVSGPRDRDADDGDHDGFLAPVAAAETPVVDLAQLLESAAAASATPSPVSLEEIFARVTPDTPVTITSMRELAPRSSAPGDGEPSNDDADARLASDQPYASSLSLLRGRRRVSA